MTAIAAEAAREPSWRSYAECCQLQGQRRSKQAREAAERFLRDARSWPFNERKRFSMWLLDRTGWVMERCGRSRYAVGGQSLICPREVIDTITLPTLIEWSNDEPNNPDPHFWLGLYAPFRANETPAISLRKAVRLDPNHGPARAALVGHILDAVSYAQHELPSGYVGKPADDLINLNEAEALLTEAVEPHVRALLVARISALRVAAENWTGRGGPVGVG